MAAPTNHGAPREFASSQESVVAPTSMSPPVRRSPRKPNVKLRRSPTVTPKRFGRFFTPRTLLQRGTRFRVSRLALGDITASAGNIKQGRRHVQIKGEYALAGNPDENGLLGCKDVPNLRKRKMLHSPDVTPEKPIASKRIRHRSMSISTELENTDYNDVDGVCRDSDEDELNSSDSVQDSPIPIIRSRFRGALGTVSRRELNLPQNASRLANTAYGADWRCETANFYSGPSDVHTCMDMASTLGRALPFCTASCNTNSLVAIGDEEGGVRLLESGKDKEPGFSKTYLSFHPHTNAVLDLAFSSDDLLLATASGDQTCEIIDMPTQRSIYSLAGHSSSVKQVCFQPGSKNNIVATSSRDGSVQIWDLRCKGTDGPSGRREVTFEGNIENKTSKASQVPSKIWARPINSIYDAHAFRNNSGAIVPPNLNPSRILESPNRPESMAVCSRRGDVSITSLAFLGESHPHLLLTGSEGTSCVKLWDLRTTYNLRRGHAVPVSTTRQPESHSRHRQYGLTSMVLSEASGRIYTLSRDNTIYVHSTTHLILGSAPELDSRSTFKRSKRSGVIDREGLGPIYGFRHPRLHVSTFYVKLALRPGKDDKSELLAVGSSNSCALVFPTDERYMTAKASADFARSAFIPRNSKMSCISPSEQLLTPASTPSFPSSNFTDDIPIYQHGAPLVRGHNNEITGSCWSSEGELVTVGDDFRARVWREDAEEARSLRLNGEKGGRRWARGWAEVDSAWDDDQE
ncbi:hypothetical protein MMC26_000944 [Xylographa opegraphella]|nr:hypothetical protein [Xylographa opegraphella]